MLAGLTAVLLAFAPLPAWAGIDLRTPGNMPTGKTVTAEQLWQEFDHALPDNVWVSPLESRRYEVISARWMRRDFLPALKEQMKQLWAKNIPAENTAGNCNGFALVARLMLSLSAMEAHGCAPAAASVIVYQGRPFGGMAATREDHAVAFVLTDEGPWIIEVQSGEYTRISDYPNRDTIKLVSVH